MKSYFYANLYIEDKIHLIHIFYGCIVTLSTLFTYPKLNEKLENYNFLKS